MQVNCIANSNEVLFVTVFWGFGGPSRFQVSIAGPVRDDAGVPDSLDPSTASLLQVLVIELTPIVYDIYHQYELGGTLC